MQIDFNLPLDVQNFNSVKGVVHGPGQIETNSGKLAPEWRYIDSRPAELSGSSSLLDAFNGDFSRVGTAIGMVVKGDALGDPQGYLFTPETSVHYSWVRMESGSNGGNDGSDGNRTGYVSNRHFIEMRGEGDAIVHNAGVGVYEGNPDAQSHLDYPAGVLYGGALRAFDDNATLAWGESFIEDNGRQVRGTGPFIKFTRDNDGEDKGEFWNGIRLASNGTKPVDAAYQVVGKFKVGVDMSMMQGEDAIALRAGQKIVWGARAPVNPISGLQRYAEDTSGPFIRLGIYGSPEGVIEAPVGSICTRLDGGPGATLYVKESGSGTSGWVAK